MNTNENSIQQSLPYVCVAARCNTCSKTFDMRTYNDLGKCPHCAFEAGEASRVYFGGNLMDEANATWVREGKTDDDDSPPWEE